MSDAEGTARGLMWQGWDRAGAHSHSSGLLPVPQTWGSAHGSTWPARKAPPTGCQTLCLSGGLSLAPTAGVLDAGPLPSSRTSPAGVSSLALSCSRTCEGITVGAGAMIQHLHEGLSFPKHDLAASPCLRDAHSIQPRTGQATVSHGPGAWGAQAGTASVETEGCRARPKGVRTAKLPALSLLPSSPSCPGAGPSAQGHATWAGRYQPPIFCRTSGSLPA